MHDELLGLLYILKLFINNFWGLLGLLGRTQRRLSTDCDCQVDRLVRWPLSVDALGFHQQSVEQNTRMTGCDVCKWYIGFNQSALLKWRDNCFDSRGSLIRRSCTRQQKECKGRKRAVGEKTRSAKVGGRWSRYRWGLDEEAAVACCYGACILFYVSTDCAVVVGCDDPLILVLVQVLIDVWFSTALPWVSNRFTWFGRSTVKVRQNTHTADPIGRVLIPRVCEAIDS